MKYILITYLLAVSVATCNKGKHLPSQPESDSAKTNDSNATNHQNVSQTIEGTWYLIPALPSDTAAGRIPSLDFNLKTLRLSGNTGCNGIGGNFVIKGDELSFGENVISTKMACPGYNESTFLENLLKTNHYKIKNGVLQLMYNTTILSNWARKVNTSSTKQI